MLALASLKDLVSSGEHRLDRMLASIADAARRLTGASGSAIAMWKDGVMVCRARSGETAPELGAQLNAQTGISGQCLRTGALQHCPDTETDPLVDREVCRNLGLRSIVVLPVRGWLEINGILEVFGTLPGTFSEHQIALLKELAALAERARAAQPHGASHVMPRTAEEKRQSSSLLPASDRVRDLASALMSGRGRQIIIGVAGIATAALVALAVWLGWRGADRSDSKTRSGAPSVVAAASRPGAQPHFPDNDPVWKPNPGGETLFSSNGKPDAGSAVKFAAKTDVINLKVGGMNAAGAAPAPTAKEGGAAAAAAAAANKLNASLKTDAPAAPQPQETALVEAPITPAQPDPSALEGVLSASVAVPELTAPISQGVSGGRLRRSVQPVYPARALTLGVQGKVVVDATVKEDGTVGGLKVVEGEPMLAQAVLDAIRQWRYQPFLLNGKPTQTDTRITIWFKLPTGR